MYGTRVAIPREPLRTSGGRRHLWVPSPDHLRPVLAPPTRRRRAQVTLALAVDEARVLSHGHFGVEHLLLGLLRQGDRPGSEALAWLGVTLAPARTALGQWLATLPRGRPPVAGWGRPATGGRYGRPRSDARLRLVGGVHAAGRRGTEVAGTMDTDRAVVLNQGNWDSIRRQRDEGRIRTHHAAAATRRRGDGALPGATGAARRRRRRAPARPRLRRRDGATEAGARRRRGGRGGLLPPPAGGVRAADRLGLLCLWSSPPA